MLNKITHHDVKWRRKYEVINFRKTVWVGCLHNFYMDVGICSSKYNDLK